MSQTAEMVEALKKALRARKLNYAQVAKGLGLSEATVKRMFSKNDFSLDRFEQACRLAEVTVAGQIDRTATLIDELPASVAALLALTGRLDVTVEARADVVRPGDDFAVAVGVRGRN